MKLWQVAKLIRSKNSGPFELTFDVIMKDRATYEKVRDAKVINELWFAKTYKLSPEKVMVINYDAASAIKVTIDGVEVEAKEGETIWQVAQRLSDKPVKFGAICAPGCAIPGVRSEAKLREVSHPWRESADAIIEVGTRESYRKSLELCRNGILGGPSSGFALAGLLRFLDAAVTDRTLDDLRNEDGEVVATFVCPDTPLPYLDKYSTHLDPSEF